MSENKVNSSVEDVKAKDEPSKVKASSVKKVKRPDGKHTKSGWSLLGLIIGLVAFVIAAYDYWLLQPQIVTSAQLKTNQDSLQEKIVALESSVNSLSKTLAEEKKFREQAVIEHDALNASMQTITAMLGRTSEAWRLAEIEYLLTIANHRLSLAQDLKTAIAIFSTADERIKAMGDPGLIPIRKAISDELSALSSVNEPDIEGVALRLGSLASAVDNLPQKQKNL